MVRGAPGQSAQVELGPGSQVGGRYVVERRLGGGGGGEAWARKPLDGRAPVPVQTFLPAAAVKHEMGAVSYNTLRRHETRLDFVLPLLPAK